MAKAISAIDVDIDKSLTDAIKATTAKFFQTKLGSDSARADWAGVERRYVQRMLARNRRGNTGFRGDISAAGQVP